MLIKLCEDVVDSSFYFLEDERNLDSPTLIQLLEHVKCLEKQRCLNIAGFNIWLFIRQTDTNHKSVCRSLFIQHKLLIEFAFIRTCIQLVK